MSVKGTDLQTLIWRAPEAGKIQQAQKTGESAQQQNFAVSLTKQAELAGSAVQNLPKPEQGKVNSDESKKEKQELSKRDDEEKDEESADEMMVTSGHIIDYRI
ncbi:MAG: hypothetical protein ABSC17_01160 [Thermacetogeniaceae bacterium]